MNKPRRPKPSRVVQETTKESAGAPSSSLIPEADADYLREHHQRQSVPEMAKALKRAAVTIYSWMAELKLPPKARVIHRDHPFKVGNRRLETTLKTFRDANEHRKKFEQ